MTLMEIVVVIGIAMILFTGVTVMFGAFRDAQVLSGETAQFTSMLDKARAQTLNAKGDSGAWLILFVSLRVARALW